jgi:hypothetical protein
MGQHRYFPNVRIRCEAFESFHSILLFNLPVQTFAFRKPAELEGFKGGIPLPAPEVDDLER